jgi:naphthoate synthase
VIAAVNGFAVGGGHVLQVMCDYSIAAESAVFRQVGPLVGSFDAGYGTWYLEEVIGRRRAKEMWMFNRRYDAQQALEWGLVNEVVPAADLMARAHEAAEELILRGASALAALKAAFSARHTGVVGQSRVAHDLLLTRYLADREHAELSAAFAEKRPPNPESMDR